MEEHGFESCKTYSCPCVDSDNIISTLTLSHLMVMLAGRSGSRRRRLILSGIAGFPMNAIFLYISETDNIITCQWSF